MTYEFTDGYKIRQQGATCFLTFTVEGWIDLFSRKTYRDIILDSFLFCRTNKGLQIHAYVIMSNHVHVIWTAKNNNLSDIIRDFKTHTSKAFIKFIENNQESRREWLLHMFKYYARGSNANMYFKVWTNNNHPEEIYSQNFYYQKLKYIHENPVRAGLVKKETDYIYSSASNYSGLDSIIPIDFLL